MGDLDVYESSFFADGTFSIPRNLGHK